MYEALGKSLVSRWERLRSERSMLETQWQEIAELMRPMSAEFTRTRTMGEKRMDSIYDSTPLLALDSLSSGLWGSVTNSSSRWFELKARERSLNESHAVKVWTSIVTERLLQAFADQGQRFYSRSLELYGDLAAFGTGVFYVDEDPKSDRIWYSRIHLAEAYIAENDREVVDTLFRGPFKMTARQAVQKFGRDAHAKLIEMAEREPDQVTDFLHAVLPRADVDLPADKLGRAFASVYVWLDQRHVCRVGGYHEFPFQTPRWSTQSRFVYGDAPGMLALPDVKMLNAQSKVTIVGAQKAVDPPILAADEQGVRGMRIRPGSIIYNGIDAAGRVRYQPLQGSGQLRLGLEYEEQRRQAIKDAFYFTLLLQADRANMTATEWLGRQEEKLRLMGPQLGRIQSEFCEPLINRVFSILARRSRPFWIRGEDGILPLPPPELLDAPSLEIDYVSPLSVAQKAAKGAAVTRTLQIVAPLVAGRPDILDNFDVDAIARIAADANGMPAEALVDRNLVAQLREQRGRQQQMMQMVAAAPELAGAAKDAMAANAMARDAAAPAAPAEAAA
jgi:hypothetical protein